MMTDSIIKELLFTVDFRNKRKYKEKRLRIGRLKGNYLRVFAKSFYNPDRLKNKTRFFSFFIHVALLLFLLLSCCRHGCCCCCWKGISKWTQKRNCNFLTPYFTKAKAKANLCIENRFRLKNHSKSSASFSFILCGSFQITIIQLHSKQLYLKVQIVSCTGIWSLDLSVLSFRPKT